MIAVKENYTEVTSSAQLVKKLSADFEVVVEFWDKILKNYQQKNVCEGQLLKCDKTRLNCHMIQ